MDNKNDYWENLSKKISDPVQTKNKRPDTSDIEVEFYRKHLSSSTELLDIGSGSGLIINKLHEEVKSVTAVEKYEGFSRFIADVPNMLVINADLLGFKIRKTFDAVLCTGVAQCFPKKDMISIYHNMFDMLKVGGVFISRMHCGLEEDIIVNGYSEELGTDYFAEYRQVDRERALLGEVGFSNVEVFDILPDSLNVWDNSRHFIFVGYK